jgi:hypothetical protein
LCRGDGRNSREGDKGACKDRPACHLHQEYLPPNRNPNANHNGIQLTQLS